VQGIENNIFDNIDPHNTANFHCYLKHIVDYLQPIHSYKVSEAIRTMTPVTITIPLVLTPQPDPNNPNGPLLPISEIGTYLWTEKHMKATAKLDKYKENMACAYIIIFHQCTPSLKNKMKVSDVFPTICNQQGPIALLKLIQNLCCSYDSKMQSVMVTVASHKRLFTYYQRDGVDNHQYYQEFCAHVETIETYDGVGAIGITPTFLTLRIKEQAAAGLVQDTANPNDAEHLAAIKLCCDEFWCALVLSGANKERLGALKNNLSSQHGFGNNLYPKSPDQCLSYLNCCTNAT
jgi:hypothetical protein